jgi:hypothetical protein
MSFPGSPGHRPAFQGGFRVFGAFPSKSGALIRVGLLAIRVNEAVAVEISIAAI